jgi:putative hydrolase of the HAD superfamily
MNIIFDLGGVVVAWEPEVIIAKVFTDAALRAMVMAEIIEHEDWRALDRGVLPRQEAIARAVQRTGLEAHVVDAFLCQVPPALVVIPETVALLYRLKARGHKLFCLSNMHVASIEHLERVYTFWEVFDGIVISCRIHLLKPEPAIYAYLLEKYGLNGTETVFIDDMEVNVAAAAQFGIHPVKFDNPAQCARRLRELGCL